MANADNSKIVLRLQALLRKMTPGGVEGCSEDELDTLTGLVGAPLPETYLAFLRVAGRSFGTAELLPGGWSTCADICDVYRSVDHHYSQLDLARFCIAAVGPPSFEYLVLPFANSDPPPYLHAPEGSPLARSFSAYVCSCVRRSRARTVMPVRDSFVVKAEGLTAMDVVERVFGRDDMDELSDDLVAGIERPSVIGTVYALGAYGYAGYSVTVATTTELDLAAVIASAKGRVALDK